VTPLQIDLRACETMALSLAEEVERRASVSAVCAELGLDWQLIEAVKCAPGRIGCGLSHLRALRLATPGRPLLILEDDVGVSESFQPILEIPPDADAVYLGASIYGAVDLVDYVGFTHMLAADEVEGYPNLLRVYNLLSTHAIVYLTERFKAAAAEAIVRSLADRDWEHDKDMARLQETCTVYAVRRPMFFQAARLQRPPGPHQEEVTNIVLEPARPGSTAGVVLAGNPRPAVLIRIDGRLTWRWREDVDGRTP
jgi:hypothetical protein